MSALDRLTRGLGTAAYGMLVVLLAVVAWRLLRGDRPRGVPAGLTT